MDVEQLVRQKWRLLKATLDERGRRLWAIEMGQDHAGNVPFATEIVPPATLAGPAGKLLTRGEVARRRDALV